MSDIPLLAPLPLGDGPKRSHVKLRKEVERIARRIAAQALAMRSEDLLLEVYCAGLAHGAALAPQLESQSNDQS